MKITYVLKSTGLCGGHRVVLEHCNRLVERGHDVTLYGLDAGWKGWFPLKATFIHYTNWEELEIRLQREEGVKVATWWETAEHVAKSKNGNDKLVYFVQEIETGYTSSIEEEREVLKTYKMPFDAFITTSDHNMKGLEKLGVNGQKVGIGYDDSMYRIRDIVPHIDKKPSILSMYRQSSLKGFDLFSDSMDRVLNVKPEIKINLFGTHAVAHTVNFTFTFHFGLPDERVAELYNEIPIYVNTSNNEGFGLPMLEAMACGSVVVCTNSGGNMDFCKDGYNSLVIKDRDPKALADRIVRLLENKKLMEKLRTNALETAKQFTWDQSINKLEEVYGQL